MDPVIYKDLKFERLPSGGVLLTVGHREGFDSPKPKYKIPSADWVNIVACVSLLGEDEYVKGVVKAVHG